MENQSYTSNKESSDQLVIYIDPEIRADFGDFSPSNVIITDNQKAKTSILKKGNRLWIIFPDGDHCDFPYYLKNLKTILEGLSAQSKKTNQELAFDSFTKSTELIEKKIFSGASLSPEDNVKDLWDEVIKKVNHISGQSQSLRSLMEKLF